MVTGTEVATAATAAKWAGAVWKAVGGGVIAGIFKPGQIRREGMANIDVEYNRELALAQAKLDAQDIRDGKKSFSIDQKRLISHETPLFFAKPIPPSEENQTPEPMQSALEAIAAEKLISEINVAQAAMHAEAELKNEATAPPEAAPSPDWVTRWRESAEKVSEDAMQEVWGRILAGEIKEPGTFSFRALEIVKNLSREDADLIAKLATYRIDDFIFRPEEDSFFNTRGLRYIDLIELQDLGIIAGVDGLGMNIQMRGQPGEPLKKQLIFNDHIMFVSSKELDKILELPIYGITRIGKQVMRLAKANDEIEYIASLQNKLTEMNYDISIHEINFRIADQINYKTTPKTL